MTEKIEKVILESLLSDEEYTRHTLPFLKDIYFDTKSERRLFTWISEFFDKQNKLPSKKILSLQLEDSGLKASEYQEIDELISTLDVAKLDNVQFITERTEKFCQDKAIYNAVDKSISILNGTDNSVPRSAVPSLLQEALSVAFDKSVGHNYFDDIEARYDFYHTKINKIPFHLDIFNKITKGGAERKTLNSVLAPTNVGKSLFLCDHAANILKLGFNVLYITLEMAEEKIAERIDCNLLDLTIDELGSLDKDRFISKLGKIHDKTKGRLVIKEYPTGGAHVGHFRALLDELKSKQNFVPDVIYIDYLNICASQRYKSNNYNSYQAIKSITEELRGLAIETNTCIWTATQTNRGGANNSDIEITDTSESFGIPMTLDFLFAIIRTEELDALNQLMVKQLKSRYGRTDYYRRFVVGVEITKFKLYDVENSPGDLVEAGEVDEPIFDKSKFGGNMKQRGDYGEIDFS